jgi:6-phosphogluconolactonase
LAKPDVRGRLDWTRVEFFFSDDRCVPPDHAESNFRLANEHLFRPLHISPEHVFRMEGDVGSPDDASRRYANLVKERVGRSGEDWPRFHLILLGLGEDGHTASLFPGTPALQEHIRLVVPSTSPKGVAQRLTFTAPLINHAEAVLFMVSGSGKAAPVRDILEPPMQSETKLPASLVNPLAGRLIWILDQAASAQLTMAKQQVVWHEE